MTLAIRPARPGEEPALSELALRSKGHWGHDAAFLERARPELTVHPEHLERWIVRVAERPHALSPQFLGLRPSYRGLDAAVGRERSRARAVSG